jgi:hypothetical protein
MSDIDELLQDATKLHQALHGIQIRGPGWSGSARQGFVFNPGPGASGDQSGAGSGGGGPPPTPPATGACCDADCGGGCTTTTEAECDASGGDYRGDGTACDDDPNPCDICASPPLNFDVSLTWDHAVDCDTYVLSWVCSFSGSFDVPLLHPGIDCRFVLDVGDVNVDYTCCPGFGTSGSGVARFYIEVSYDGSSWSLLVLVQKVGQNWCGVTGDLDQQTIPPIDLGACPLGSHGISVDTGGSSPLVGTVTVSRP